MVGLLKYNLSIIFPDFPEFLIEIQENFQKAEETLFSFSPFFPIGDLLVFFSYFLLPTVQ
jgi:hypothetical protein